MSILTILVVMAFGFEAYARNNAPSSRYMGGPAELVTAPNGAIVNTHPHISPVHGNFEGFPPSYLISGTRDLLLSDTVRIHQKLRRAGIDADLHIYEGQSHADYLKAMNASESFEHFAELNAFLLKHLQYPLSPVLPQPVETLEDVEIPKSVGF